MATRGKDGPGEVQVRVNGATETYIAYSEEPIPANSVVTIYEVHAGRRVDVVI